jgi:hypothetical protein
VLRIGNQHQCAIDFALRRLGSPLREQRRRQRRTGERFVVGRGLSGKHSDGFSSDALGLRRTTVLERESGERPAAFLCCALLAQFRSYFERVSSRAGLHV